MGSRDPYLIYGRRTVREYLSTDIDASAIKDISITSGLPADLKAAISSAFPDTPLKEISRKHMDMNYSDLNHQGVMIRLNPGRHPQLQKNREWKNFIAEKNGLLIALDRIQDPGNLGNIIRSAEALGARAIFVTGKGATLTPAVDRSSSGATMHAKIFQIANINRLIDEARRAGYWICVAVEGRYENNLKIETITLKKTDAVTSFMSSDNDQFPPTQESLLIIGGEGSGAKALVRKKADYFLSVPIRGKIKSLNASVAAGILLDRFLNR